MSDSYVKNRDEPTNRYVPCIEYSMEALRFIYLFGVYFIISSVRTTILSNKYSMEKNNRHR